MVGDQGVDLDTVRTLAILGEIDSGKSNLAFWYLNNYSGNREKYVFGYPKEVPDMISLSAWDDLLKVRNGVIFIDELQNYVKTYDKRANVKLMELLSFFAHKNNTLVFTTQVSQFITRGVEAFIDCWAFKKMDMETLKNGSKPKRILQRLCSIRKNDWLLDLEKNEFYEFSERNPIGENRIKAFPDQNVKKEWA